MNGKLNRVSSSLFAFLIALGALGPSGASAQVRSRLPALPVPPSFGGAAAPVGLPALQEPQGAALSALSSLSEPLALPAAPDAPEASAPSRFPSGRAPGTPDRDRELVRYFADQYRAEGALTFISDLDDTLADNSNGKGSAISDEMVRTILRLQAKGNRFILNTNRPFRLIDKATGEDRGAFALFAARLPERARANLLMATASGAEIWQFGPNGETPEQAAWNAPAIPAEQKQALGAVMEKALAFAGLSASDVDFQLKEHQAVVVLRNGREKMGALAADIRRSLEAAELAFNVVEKQPSNPQNSPYIVVSGLDKSTNTRGLRELLALEGIRPKASTVLLSGDDFHEPGFDTAMQRGWPGARSLSVGHKISTGLKKTYLYSRPGPDSSLEFFKRLADALDAL